MELNVNLKLDEVLSHPNVAELLDKSELDTIAHEVYSGFEADLQSRSGWEKRVMDWCDTNSSIVSWSSEEIIIPYISPVDNRPHRYFVFTLNTIVLLLPDFTISIVTRLSLMMLQ